MIARASTPAAEHSSPCGASACSLAGQIVQPCAKSAARSWFVQSPRYACHTVTHLVHLRSRPCRVISHGLSLHLEPSCEVSAGLLHFRARERGREVQMAQICAAGIVLGHSRHAAPSRLAYLPVLSPGRLPQLGRGRAALVTERDRVPVRHGRTRGALREPVPQDPGVARGSFLLGIDAGGLP